MSKTYSSDLRERVVTQVNAGNSRREVARRFGVSPSFVVKLMQLVADTGSTTAAKRGRPFGQGKLAGGQNRSRQCRQSVALPPHAPLSSCERLALRLRPPLGVPGIFLYVTPSLRKACQIALGVTANRAARSY